MATDGETCTRCPIGRVMTDGLCRRCALKDAGGVDPGVYPPDPPPPALPGITAEDFAQLIDHAKNRRMRSFHLRTTIKGVSVDFEGVFEPDPTRKEPRRE